MRPYLLFILNLMWFFVTCEPKENGLTVERLKTNEPVKMLIGGSKNDSTKIFMYIPQKVKITNNYSNKIRLSHAFISLEGANIMEDNPLYQMSDSLYFVKSKTYIKGEEISYLLYAGYGMIIHDSELDSLKTQGNFAQFQYKREVYDIGSLKKSLDYICRKIPDSIRGYMNLNFYNFETKFGFVESIPVEF